MPIILSLNLMNRTTFSANTVMLSTFSITQSNFSSPLKTKNRSKEKLIHTVQIPEQEDDFNAIRQEYSKMLTDKLLKGANGQSAKKFLTFGIESTSYKSARAKLMSIKNDIIKGSKHSV